ncbi:MAG: hypothetical protein ACOC33_03100 [bacterium]
MKIKDIIKEEVEKVIKEKVHKDSGLGKWFKQSWVDVTKKKKDGSHPTCGASASKGKRKDNHFSNYPVCRPEDEAEKMTKKEKENLKKRKQKAVKKDNNKKSPARIKIKK